MNRIDERALTIVYNDKSSSNEELLDIDSSVSIHIRNLQVLAREVSKSNYQISPVIMQGHFKICGSEFCYLKSICYIHSSFHLKIIGDIL